jgi:hypothetical protein
MQIDNIPNFFRTVKASILSGSYYIADFIAAVLEAEGDDLILTCFLILLDIVG